MGCDNSKEHGEPRRSPTGEGKQSQKPPQKRVLADRESRAAERRSERDRNEQLWSGGGPPKGGMGGAYRKPNNRGSSYLMGKAADGGRPKGGCGGSYGRLSSYGGSPRSSAGAQTPRGGCGGDYRRAGSNYGGSRYGSQWGGSEYEMSAGAQTPRGGCGGTYRASHYGGSRCGSRRGSQYAGSSRAQSVGQVPTPRAAPPTPSAQPRGIIRRCSSEAGSAPQPQ